MAHPKPDSRRTLAKQKDPRTPGDPGAELVVPEELSEDGRATWELVVPELLDLGALTRADLPLLVELVESFAMAQAYRRRWHELQAEGKVEEHDRYGNAYQVDFLGSQVEKRIRSGYVAALAQVEKLAGQFGLNPTARMRLGLMAARGRELTLDQLLDQVPE